MRLNDSILEKSVSTGNCDDMIDNNKNNMNKNYDDDYDNDDDAVISKPRLTNYTQIAEIRICLPNALQHRQPTLPVTTIQLVLMFPTS